MNPRIIKVILKAIDDIDVLVFQLNEDEPDEYVVNLNSTDSQGSLKHVFSALLNILIEEEIKLELEIADGYKKGLYKDVCNEYITDLNRELIQVKSTILNELA